MKIETQRFGAIDLKEENFINFKEGLPGFEDVKQFCIINTGDTFPIYWLQAIDNPISLPVVDPFLLIDNYSIDLTDEESKELEIESQEDLLVLNVVVLPEDILDTTANLISPLIINVNKKIGKQIILDGDWNVRHPIFGQLIKAIKAKEKEEAKDNKD